MGDSSLSKSVNGKNYYLSCYHGEKQREWLVRKHEWLIPASRPIQWCAYLDKRTGKVFRGGRFHTVSIPCFTKLAELLYREGKKHLSDELLDLITHPVVLACLICDDGSWDRAGIAIASKGFTIEENRRLAATLHRVFRLSISVQQQQKYPFVRVTAKSVEDARRLCEPYVPESLRYKFGPHGYATTLCGKVNRTCTTCGKSFASYESSEQLFCSRRCATKGRRSGYSTRKNTTACLLCGVIFLVYNRRQRFCPDCRRKYKRSNLRVTAIPCAICGKPVVVEGRKTCSRSCGVRLGHWNRPHVVKPNQSGLTT